MFNPLTPGDLTVNSPSLLLDISLYISYENLVFNHDQDTSSTW